MTEKLQPEHEMGDAVRAKIDEYVARIQAGEDRARVTEGPPPKFLESIDQALRRSEAAGEFLSHEYPLVLVPPQYEGLSADALEEIWTIPAYEDRSKREEQERWKARVVRDLREKERVAAAAEQRRVDDHGRAAAIRDALVTPPVEDRKKR